MAIPISTIIEASLVKAAFATSQNDFRNQFDEEVKTITDASNGDPHADIKVFTDYSNPVGVAIPTAILGAMIGGGRNAVKGKSIAGGAFTGAATAAGVGAGASVGAKAGKKFGGKVGIKDQELASVLGAILGAAGGGFAGHSLTS